MIVIMIPKGLIFDFLQLLILVSFIKFAYTQDIFLNLNTKKVVAVTSDKFLSLTLDPAVLLTGDVFASSTEISTNMAKALAPGYVRLAGPKSNSYTFERSLFPQNGYEDPTDFTFSEAHWVLVQQWAERAGLDVVSALKPQRIENEDQTTTWDPRNSLDLISFSDHMGYNMSWQLGYECQTRCDISGFDLGKDVARLKNMLAAFPRYANSVIAGPDIVSFRGKQQQQFIQDYMNSAGNALSVITWHPNFAGIALDSDGVTLQIDTLAADRDLLYKSMGRSVAKKPLWIAESKPEECKQQFLGALVWARRLGNAAKLGVQVIMRQPDTSNMFQPTPDYWVSLLHKMLVGKEVLDARLTSGNISHVHFYSHCTKPSAKYDRGAITIFGINLTPGKVSVSLKGLKIKTVHKYILMPGYDTDNRMFAETVLLNNEPLTLVNGKNLPEINPDITSIGKNSAVKLPSGGIGFWVIPGARVKSCLGHDEDGGEKNLLLKKLTKKLEESDMMDENLGHELEDDNQNQDLELDSTEDIKSIFKSKKKRRKYWHSDENDDEERKFKRIDTKKELEKLEKFLKKNTNIEEKKGSYFKGKVGLGMFDSGEKEGGDNKGENLSSDENVGLMRFKKNNEKANSGEEIRAKLEEYKNKLDHYESKKKSNDKNDEQIARVSLRRIPQHADERFINEADTQKAVEALGLISKFEGAIRNYGKSNENNKYNDETMNSKTLNLTPDIGEEILIEELEKSDKIKRMIDPKSMDKIYQFLMSNANRGKVQKRNIDNTEDKTMREKRDLEKLLGDDPLGLRKEGLFKKRFKTDEPKERRFERRNRRKDKEEIGLKKELPLARLDTRLIDSGENSFFGIPQMKPLENFPQGDVFLKEGSSSEEKSHDYDYVRDDEEDEDQPQDFQKSQKNDKRRKPNNKKQNKVVQDEIGTWVEEPDSTLRNTPNEFFEKVKYHPVVIKNQWKDHGELYEPESLLEKDFKDERKTNENDVSPDIVIVKDRPDEREDKRAKETAVKKLINYFDNSQISKTESQNFQNERPRPRVTKNKPKPTPQPSVQRKPKENLKTNSESMPKEQKITRVLEFDKEWEDSVDPGSLDFVNSKPVEDYSEEMSEEILENIPATKKRPKRKTPNLDVDIFGQEMIREDAGNLKDCKCRVIRNTGRVICKNCRKNRRRQRDVLEMYSIEDIADRYIPEINDQSSELCDSTPEEVAVKVIEAPEIGQEEIVNSKETIQISDGLLPQKNTEVTDLNVDKNEGNSYVETIHEVGLTSDSSFSSKNDADSAIIDLGEHTEVVGQPNSNSQVIDTTKEENIIMDIPVNDAIGSQRITEEVKEDEVIVEKHEKPDSEEKILEKRIENQEKLDSEEKILEKKIENQEKPDSGEKILEKKMESHISENLNAKSGIHSSKKLSLNTGLGSSLKTETLKDCKLKSALDLKLKSGGLKTDLAKNKLILNTEALSALMKESENKKTDVLKALETSSKLKSFDNTKYIEYQRKRDEKLATLKDKLKERKAKILQQYRQELLDALCKCEDEVERNLKRREIWEDFNNQEEFQEFVDKDKLAYLMMNRPVDFENIEEQNDDEVDQTEERRYYPEIELIQPLRNPRERKIPDSEYRGYVYLPKKIQFSSSSDENYDQSSLENPKDEPYYAIVESLEEPKIFHKQHFDKYRNSEKLRNKFDDPIVHIFDEELIPESETLSHYNEENKNSWNYLGPEHHDGILYNREYSKPIHPRSRDVLPELTGIENYKNFHNSDEIPQNGVTKIHLNDQWKILQKLGSPCSDGNCGGNNYFPDPQELDESLDSTQEFIVRKERDTNEKKQPNYICLKEDSREDYGEDEKRSFKLVKHDGHYEAVPVSKLSEDTRVEKPGANHRRFVKNVEKVKNKRRKYSPDILADEEGNYYVKDAGFYGKNLSKKQYRENQPFGKENNEENKHKNELQRKSYPGNVDIDPNSLEDEMSRLELSPKLSPEEYELLMLIPVKKHKVKRQKRDLENNMIDRFDSFEKPGEFWDDVVIGKDNKNNLLKEYVDAKDKTLRDFEEAQANLNKYLKKVESIKDPVQLQNFEKIILNLGSQDQEKIAVVAKSQDEVDKIHLGEYLKKEIMKKVNKNAADNNRNEKSTTPVSVGSTSPTFFDLAIPKLENTINQELEKVGNISESLEDFINEFDSKFNTTSETNNYDIDSENANKNKKISHRIFHTAIDKVKRFFNFLTGLSLFFRRY